MKITLVGQGPGPRKPPERAFDGPGQSGNRIPALLDLTRKEFLSLVDTANLMKSHAGKQGKGDVFYLDEARTSARELLASSTPKFFLLAGKRVGQAFGLNDRDYFKITRMGKHAATVVPHPSGVNMWWNDPNNVERARRFLKLVFYALSK